MLFAIFRKLAYIIAANTKQFALLTAPWLSPGLAMQHWMQLHLFQVK